MFGVPGVRVQAADHEADGLSDGGTELAVEGCRGCRVLAAPYGRRVQVLQDAPFGHRRVRVWWRKRVWRCREPLWAVLTFTESHPLPAPRARLTSRAVLWATDAVAEDDPP